MVYVDRIDGVEPLSRPVLLLIRATSALTEATVYLNWVDMANGICAGAQQVQPVPLERLG